jgi:hydroxymethylpyrimidine kinase/phosphomethylpyrimidine kinase
MSGRVAKVLSIAGSDPSGGAGIQADLKTFAALGCYGMAAITALTAQNTRGVSAVHVPPPEFLAAQIDAIFSDIAVDAVKIGMLGTPEIVAVVADRLSHWGARNIVLDPVLVATSGDSLGAPGVVEAMLEELIPLARLVTPNLPEVARLAGRPAPLDLDAMQQAGEALAARGAKAVLVKGGHLQGEAVDLLVVAGGARAYAAPRIETRNTHGTGCTLSSAIAAFLARGAGLEDAVGDAKAYLTAALRSADRLEVGGGHGPVDHLHVLSGR